MWRRREDKYYWRCQLASPFLGDRGSDVVVVSLDGEDHSAIERGWKCVSRIQSEDAGGAAIRGQLARTLQGL